MKHSYSLKCSEIVDAGEDRHTTEPIIDCPNSVNLQDEGIYRRLPSSLFKRTPDILSVVFTLILIVELDLFTLEYSLKSIGLIDDFINGDVFFLPSLSLRIIAFPGILIMHKALLELFCA